ncbi:hypothetical protein BK139_14880 [Paenibacillus sp. FSL R5-0490]|uniref:hypothetical protein n=1 Tax=Bacillales TaxID=1385 RepID=UPI00096DB4B8|nr:MULTISPECIES: hypothetical protein [Bacillales]OMF56580.1 hypothetical protein BK139_14880 [Paenibacillus sp. FSL R5-0490]PAE24749.1 hypothetical protein CHI10_11525 [Bacillus sp. 7894-2]
MAIDFDPFDVLDMNYDMEVDANDLQMYELENHGTYSINDIDHDLVLDKFDMDLNNDLYIDKFQADLDHNNIIDSFEQNFGLTNWNHDLNHDKNIDAIDQALAKSIYGL